jgi:hypothetical protein
MHLSWARHDRMLGLWAASGDHSAAQRCSAPRTLLSGQPTLTRLHEHEPHPIPRDDTDHCPSRSAEQLPTCLGGWRNAQARRRLADCAHRSQSSVGDCSGWTVATGHPCPSFHFQSEAAAQPNCLRHRPLSTGRQPPHPTTNPAMNPSAATPSFFLTASLRSA